MDTSVFLKAKYIGFFILSSARAHAYLSFLSSQQAEGADLDLVVSQHASLTAPRYRCLTWRVVIGLLVTFSNRIPVLG